MTLFNLAGMISGVQVWDWSDPTTVEKACKISPLLCDVKLRFDEVYPSYSTSSILVGELAHYLYRVHQVALNHECRAAASRHIKAEAERILGESYELVDRQRDWLDNVSTSS